MSVNMKQSGALIPIASLTKAIIPLGTGDCYSTEERQVGCFVDGKPLYQKTFNNLSISMTAGEWIDTVSSAGMDEIISAFGILTYTGNAYMVNFDTRIVEGSSYVKVISRNVSNVQTLISLTLQYTKTTDTAGSGIWTPDGTPAHHYSLTEHIIGTWYDGSTLYEKTKVIPFSSFNVLSSGWRYTYNYRGSNEDVKKIEGYANSPTYGKCYIGVRNYESNSTMSNYYFELDNYYSTLNLNFVGNNASVIGVTEVVITYQYTKTA